MKVILSEMKKNPLGNNSEGKEAGFQINDLKHKEEINSQPVQNEETKIPPPPQKWGENKKTLGHLQMCQHLNHRDARKRRRRAKNENLFENIMKKNFPNLVKEIDIQVQEAQSPKQVGPYEDHT